MTAKAGWNRAGQSPYVLNRFLDRDDLSEVRFEAELAGLSEWWRKLKARVRRRPGPFQAPHGARGAVPGGGRRPHRR